MRLGDWRAQWAFLSDPDRSSNCNTSRLGNWASCWGWTAVDPEVRTPPPEADAKLSQNTLPEQWAGRCSRATGSQAYRGVGPFSWLYMSIAFWATFSDYYHWGVETTTCSRKGNLRGAGSKAECLRGTTGYWVNDRAGPDCLLRGRPSHRTREIMLSRRSESDIDAQRLLEGRPGRQPIERNSSPPYPFTGIICFVMGPFDGLIRVTAHEVLQYRCGGSIASACQQLPTSYPKGPWPEPVPGLR